MCGQIRKKKMDKQTRNDASEYLEVAVAVELSRLAGGQHHAAVRDRERGAGHVIPVRVHREGAVAAEDWSGGAA